MLTASQSRYRETQRIATLRDAWEHHAEHCQAVAIRALERLTDGETANSDQLSDTIATAWQQFRGVSADAYRDDAKIAGESLPRCLSGAIWHAAKLVLRGRGLATSDFAYIDAWWPEHAGRRWTLDQTAAEARRTAAEAAEAKAIGRAILGLPSAAEAAVESLSTEAAICMHGAMIGAGLC